MNAHDPPTNQLPGRIAEPTVIPRTVLHQEELGTSAIGEDTCITFCTSRSIVFRQLKRLRGRDGCEAVLPSFQNLGSIICLHGHALYPDLDPLVVD